jgi:hypothetical protein
MRSAAPVRVAGSADDGVGNVISIHISAILVIYIPKSLVREVATRAVSSFRCDRDSGRCDLGK